MRKPASSAGTRSGALAVLQYTWWSTFIGERKMDKRLSESSRRGTLTSVKAEDIFNKLLTKRERETVRRTAERQAAGDDSARIVFTVAASGTLKPKARPSPQPHEPAACEPRRTPGCPSRQGSSRPSAWSSRPRAHGPLSSPRFAPLRDTCIATGRRHVRANNRHSVDGCAIIHSAGAFARRAPTAPSAALDWPMERRFNRGRV